MKNKMVVGFMVMMILFTTGCSNVNDRVSFNFYGKYTYDECVHLNVLSSSTIDYQTELYRNQYYYEFGDSTLSYYSDEDHLLETYENIEYKNVDKNKDIDGMFSLGIEDFLDSVEYRFDIYSNDKMIGFTIFQSEDSVYLAETRMIGSNNDVLVVWNIFEIVNQ